MRRGLLGVRRRQIEPVVRGHRAPGPPENTLLPHVLGRAPAVEPPADRRNRDTELVGRAFGRNTKLSEVGTESHAVFIAAAAHRVQVKRAAGYPKKSAAAAKLLLTLDCRDGNIAKSKEPASMTKTTTNLEGTDLRRAALQDAKLRGADLRGADLSGADLRGADLRGANLYDASLRHADLRGANLHGATVEKTEFGEADLRGSILRGTILDRVSFRGSDLRGADLRAASLLEADLRGADLRGARLDRADLGGSYLFEAVFDGLELSVATLCGVDLSAAKVEDLRVFQADLWMTLTQSRDEVPGLAAALREGRINGSSYEGECACLIGTIARLRGVPYSAIHHKHRDPAEAWFSMISPGDTPGSKGGGGFAARRALEWILEWCALCGVEVSP